MSQLSQSQSSQSAFDLQMSLIQDIISVANQDNQRMESEIKRARQQLEQLRNVVENKNLACIRELQPRIEQLEEKISFYWDGVKKLNERAWQDMREEENILAECQSFVKKMEEKASQMQGKI